MRNTFWLLTVANAQYGNQEDYQTTANLMNSNRIEEQKRLNYYISEAADQVGLLQGRLHTLDERSMYLEDEISLQTLLKDDFDTTDDE